MGIQINEDGELNDNWQEEYNIVRQAVIDFCNDNNDEDPDIVVFHIESVELDMLIHEEMERQPDELREWDHRRESVEYLIEQTNQLIEFGDSRFVTSIERLKELKNILRRLKKTIPQV